MQVYTIPSISTPLYSFLTVDTSFSIPPKYISHSLSFFLQDLKDKIHVHEKEWDNYKKYTIWKAVKNIEFSKSFNYYFDNRN